MLVFFLLGCGPQVTIPRSRHDPKVLGRDDAEVVGDRIAEVRPIARNLVAQEIAVSEEECHG